MSFVLWYPFLVNQFCHLHFHISSYLVDTLDKCQGINKYYQALDTASKDSVCFSFELKLGCELELDCCCNQNTSVAELLISLQAADTR